jgi:uncharacterized membrane protein YkoI
MKPLAWIQMQTSKTSPTDNRGSHITSVVISSCIVGLLLTLSSPFLSAQQLSPAEAASSARSFTGGKVLKVKTLRGDKIDYRVKILLPEGRVRNIIVDGDNGEAHFPNIKSRKTKNPNAKDRKKKSGRTQPAKKNR